MLCLVAAICYGQCITKQACCKSNIVRTCINIWNLYFGLAGAAISASLETSITVSTSLVEETFIAGWTLLVDTTFVGPVSKGCFCNSPVSSEMKRQNPSLKISSERMLRHIFLFPTLLRSS